MPGSGKTHFIKYFLTLCCQNNNLPYGWKQTFKDVYYIEYNGDIKCSLQTISTLKNYESQDDFSSVCDFSNSLLVIDCMYYRENFEDDLEYLSSLPFKIIVITHSGNNNIAGFCRFPFFPKLTDTDLISIFMTYGKLNNNKEVIQKNWPRIKSLTCNNPLIISLLAKQYLALNLNPDSESLNRVLSILEETNTKKDMNKVFKHNNDTANMAGHIRKIFINLIEKIAPDKNANYIFIAACISYFGWEKIPLSFLKKVIPCVSDFDESIQFLIQSGILSSDHISVQMPVLIVYSLQYYTISKSNDSDISYKSIIQLSQNLNNYLDNLSDKEFYLGNILFHFVKNLYGKIKETNNPNQLSTSKNFELWQILLQKICLYYHDYGNFKAEESVSELFRFPDGIQNKSSKLNQNIIKLESFLYQCRNPGTDEFAKTLTDYIDSIDQLISTELLEDIKNLYQIDNSSSHNLSTSFTHKYYGFSIVLRNLVDMNINLFFYTQFYETEPNCEIKEGKINWSHTIQTNPNFNLYPALKTLFPNNCGTDYQMRYYDFTSKIVYEKKSLHNDITIQKNISYYMTEAFYGKSRIEKEFLLRGCAVSLYALFFKIPTRRFRSPQELKIYVNNQMSRFEQGINYCYNISHETFRICYFILHLVSFCLLYYFKLPLDCKKYIENLSKKCPYITYAKDNTFQLLE